MHSSSAVRHAPSLQIVPSAHVPQFCGQPAATPHFLVPHAAASSAAAHAPPPAALPKPVPVLPALASLVPGPGACAPAGPASGLAAAAPPPAPAIELASGVPCGCTLQPSAASAISHRKLRSTSTTS